MSRSLVCSGMTLFAVIASYPLAAAQAAGWQDVAIPLPDEKVRISYERHDFAQGSFEVAIAKGGPTGYEVWAHLHGRNPGDGGSQYYKVAAMVLGDDGYPYFISDIQTLTLGGKGDKHKFGMWAVEGDDLKSLQQAIKNEVKFKAVAAGSRDHADFAKRTSEGVAKVVVEYFREKGKNEPEITRTDLFNSLSAIAKSAK